MLRQAYVSPELTHFLGLDGTYQSLLDILRSKTLKKGASSIAGAPASIAFDYVDELDNGEPCCSDCVCFCDIPVSQLGIHMEKYGRFGIAFLKGFLISQGACPVHYVPEAFRLRYPAVEALLGGSGPGTPVLCSDLYKEVRRCFLLFQDRFLSPPKALDEDTGKQERDTWDHALRTIGQILCLQVFPFLKLFDHNKDDDDKGNYYMEREWRVLGGVQFELDNVWRIILPREYAAQLRNDVPEYCGQITFAP